MFSKLKIIIAFTLFSSALFSQILNVDRLIERDSIHNKWNGYADISFSSDKNKKNLLDGSSRIEMDRFLKNEYILIASLNNDFTFNGKDAVQNEGFAQIRYRDNDKHNWSNESYIQYQWNGSLGMDFRKVVGSNIRKRFFEKKKLDLYSGLGVFYESEQWNWNGVENYELYSETPTNNRSFFRLNHYWKMAYKINDNVDISTLSYFQFPLNQDFANLRWFFELNTYVKMTKNTNFVIHWDHTYDNYRIVPISNYYYTLNFGIQLKW